MITRRRFVRNASVVSAVLAVAPKRPLALAQAVTGTYHTGKPWQRTQESAEISGMHHDVLGGFLDVRPAAYACGSGKATLRNYLYWPMVNVPS
jgi:hypothetical protein